MYVFLPCAFPFQKLASCSDATVGKSDFNYAEAATARIVSVCQSLTAQYSLGRNPGSPRRMPTVV